MYIHEVIFDEIVVIFIYIHEGTTIFFIQSNTSTIKAITRKNLPVILHEAKIKRIFKAKRKKFIHIS